MRTPKKPPPAMLFAGCLYSTKDYLLKAKDLLIENFGPIIFESDESEWKSRYYVEELGSPIRRKFLFFERLIDPGKIADIKLQTNHLESLLSEEGKRKINIDPGYLTLYSMILASTKNYAHRIYLERGIFGDVTLIYDSREKTYKPQLFTYMDFREEQNIAFFLRAREVLKRKLPALEYLEEGLE